MKLKAQKVEYGTKWFILYKNILIDINHSAFGKRRFTTINLKNHNVTKSPSLKYVFDYIDNQFTTTLNPLTGFEKQTPKKYL